MPNAQQDYNSRRRVARRRVARLSLLAGSVGLMMGFGLITPELDASLTTQMVVVGFAVSMIISLATIVALIPSPPDPRESARLIIRRLERSERDQDS